VRGPTSSIERPRVATAQACNIDAFVDMADKSATEQEGRHRGGFTASNPVICLKHQHRRYQNRIVAALPPSLSDIRISATMRFALAAVAAHEWQHPRVKSSRPCPTTKSSCANRFGHALCNCQRCGAPPMRRKLLELQAPIDVSPCQ